MIGPEIMANTKIIYFSIDPTKILNSEYSSIDIKHLQTKRNIFRRNRSGFDFKSHGCFFCIYCGYITTAATLHIKLKSKNRISLQMRSFKYRLKF